jgi:hypothetical protein
MKWQPDTGHLGRVLCRSLQRPAHGTPHCVAPKRAHSVGPTVEGLVNPVVGLVPSTGGVQNTAGDIAVFALLVRHPAQMGTCGAAATDQ